MGIVQIHYPSPTISSVSTPLDQSRILCTHHAKCTFVAALISTRVDAIRVLLRICAEDLEACIPGQWQNVVLILEQCDSVSGDFPRNFCMVTLNIYEFVDHARWGE
jgi:hypothetical protein